MTEYMQSKISQLKVEDLKQVKANNLKRKLEEEESVEQNIQQLKNANNLLKQENDKKTEEEIKKIKLEKFKKDEEQKNQRIKEIFKVEFDDCMSDLLKGKTGYISLEKISLKLFTTLSNLVHGEYKNKVNELMELFKKAGFKPTLESCYLTKNFTYIAVEI